MKYIRLFFLTTLLVTLSSCTEWLVIEPEGKVVSTDYWKLESDVEAVIAASYRAMIENDIIQSMIIFGEVRSDNVLGGYNQGEYLQKIMEANIQPSNPYTRWGGFYRIINYANIVLYYAPQVVDPNFSQAELNAKMAEALAIRALSYFYLVRAYGEVPFVTDPSVTDTQDYLQGKVSENVILDALEADLIKAEGWAMTNYGKLTANKGRITKNAIRALLADIYLWRNKYDQCIEAADRVINDPLLKMIEADDDPYFKIFGNKNSTESIFELQFSSKNYTYNGTINSFYGNIDNPSGQFIVPEIITTQNDIFVNTPKVTDIRRKDFITNRSSNNVFNIFKYAGLIRNERSDGVTSDYIYRIAQSSPANWIVYRLTDVMLMKAEALVQKDQYLPALQLVNKTYIRSNPTLTDTLSLTQYNDREKMEKLVMLERQRELMFEGKRWFDLMRMARRDGNTNRLVEIVTKKLSENQSVVSSKLKVMDALYFPIHEDELKANSNLKQNPYYESKFK